MRADRLIATVLLLQARTRVTAAELARELEVSVATARRDLAALSAAGVPVYPQPGRGGGWQLVGGARTDLTGLTESQARQLFLLLGPAAAGRPDATAALAKLHQALPASFRAGAAAAGLAVLVDPDGWGERRAGRPEIVATLEQSVIDRAELRLQYRPRQGDAEVSSGDDVAVVRPLAVVSKGDSWYLLAERGERREPGPGDRNPAGTRTYRIDRIRSATRTGEHFTAPEPAEVRAAWSTAMAQVEAIRGAVAATVTVPAALVPVLRKLFGRHFTLEPADQPGQPPSAALRAVVTAHTVTGLAEQLAGFGSTIEVTAPAAVRTELARIGAELLARYSD